MVFTEKKAKTNNPTQTHTFECIIYLFPPGNITGIIFNQTVDDELRYTFSFDMENNSFLIASVSIINKYQWQVSCRQTATMKIILISKATRSLSPCDENSHRYLS